MRSFKIVLSALTVLTLTTACQKSDTASGIATDQIDAQAALDSDCAEGSAADSSLKVSGLSSAQAGDTIVYQINKKICNTASKVEWDMGGTKEVETTTPVVVSSFKAAGHYVVSAKIADESAIQTTVIVSKSPAIEGPQVVQIAMPIGYQLVLPQGFQMKSVKWNFGDTSAEVTSGVSVQHSFMQEGLFDLKVTVIDSADVIYNLSQSVNVFADSERAHCGEQASISSPTEANVNTPIAITGFLPNCLKVDLTNTKFDFGDGTTSANLINEHTYSAVGTYRVTLDINTIFQDDPATPYIRLSHSVQVIDPNQNCPAIDATQVKYSDSFTRAASCGVSGTKTQAYHTKITEQCLSNQGSLTWTEVSRVDELQSEGACQGQSCTLPDGTLLVDGASKKFFSTNAPIGSCDENASVRSCNNGVLSGPDAFNQLTCRSGCGEFGADGTVKTGVVTGEIKTPLKCAYNEEGFFSTFNQIADQKCNDGQIVTSNTRQGDLKHADVCPDYKWKATTEWSTCSADCGGVQYQKFTCQNDKNETVPNDRCANAQPVVSRVCDGNPQAVARVETLVSEEEGGSSVQCPKNQIGVVTQSRTATVTNVYACINHTVQVDSKTEYSAWVTHSYCRDYVAYRCSQDSLSNEQAVQRYKWMLKCQNDVPIIKEFLDHFADVKAGGSYEVDTKSRVLYPTFMTHADGKEKVWIAPIKETASCAVPKDAYIAAVCVSSCATPEQQIMVEAKNKKNQYTSYIEALTQKTAKVATLGKNSQLNSKAVQNTAVDQWVTEMLDTEHVILEFRMKSGRSLRLTPNHPVVAQDGSMKTADSFKAGESLVELGGGLDQIQSIKSSNYVGKVYNLFVKSSEPLENIVVTNGYLNGTAFYQNEGAVNMNHALLKKKLTWGVFSK